MKEHYGTNIQSVELMLTLFHLKYLKFKSVLSLGIFIGLVSSAWGAPVISSIAPSAGPTSGGTPFTINGSGFLPGVTVKIGNVFCAQVKVVSGTTVMGVTGSNSAGVKSVIVSNPGNDSNTPNSLYTYNFTTDLTKTTMVDFEAVGSTITSLNTTGLDSTLRWTDWTPTTGGSMGAGTFYYVVTATNANGETRKSVQSAGTSISGANNAINLNWTPIAGALQYKLYRSVTSDTYSSPALIATLDTAGYKDTAASPVAGAPPGLNGATGDIFLSFGGAPDTVDVAGPDFSSSVSRDGFAIQRSNGTFLIVHGRTSTVTSIYDPATNSMSAGPSLTGNAQDGCHGFKLPDGRFLIVHGNNSTSTSLYEPVPNTIVAGPVSTANINNGGHSLKRPDGTFLIVHGNSTATTSIYDPLLNTMSSGPAMTGNAGNGAHALQKPDGKFLIIFGNNTTATSIYDGVSNGMSAGPTLTDQVGSGGHAIQRPDGQYLIVCGRGTRFTVLYNPIGDNVVSGPQTPTVAGLGSHSIQRANGTFIGFAGGGTRNVFVYDPVANTMSASPNFTYQIGAGAHSIQLPDGKFLLVCGSLSTRTSLYNAGWFRTGSYISEKLNPVDINFWNVFSWVRDLDDTLTTKIKTAPSSVGLDAAGWRSVANGGSINPATGETWLQIGTDYSRAIPKNSLELEDVWGRWRAEFRKWSVPDLLSVTANYTSSSLSVSPSKTAFAFGGQPQNTWVSADSTFLRNDGISSQTLFGKISTFTAGAFSWELSSASNGADSVRVQWSTSSNSGPWSDISEYNQDFTINTEVAAGDSAKFFLRIQTPTSSQIGIQYSTTLTVTAQ